VDVNDEKKAAAEADQHVHRCTNPQRERSAVPALPTVQAGRAAFGIEEQLKQAYPRHIVH